MLGHIAFEELDPSGLPSSLSRVVTTQLLRDEMGFRGLVMTDDLDMGAVLKYHGFEEMIRLGLSAGNDLLMICHRTELACEAINVLAKCPSEQLDRALSNIANFKSRMASPYPFTEQAFLELDREVWDLRVATLGEDRASARSIDDGKRSPVEVY